MIGTVNTAHLGPDSLSREFLALAVRRAAVDFFMPMAIGLSLFVTPQQSFAAASSAPDNPELPDQASPAISAIEAFKAFLSAPPVIEDLVFRQKVEEPPTGQGTFDLLSTNSARSSLFRAVYQHNATLFYQANSETTPPEYAPHRLIVSIYDDEHWLLDGKGFIETCTAVPGTITNPITIGIAIQLVPLRQALQGGVLHVRPGDIRWTGNKFIAKATPTPYRLFLDVEGELVEDGGRAAEMFVTYAGTNSSVNIFGRWRLKYSYDRHLGVDYFPSRIQGFSVQDGRETEVDDIEILTLKTRPSLLPQQVFDPRPALAASGMPIHILTNGFLYVRRPNGTLTKWQNVSKPQPLPQPPGLLGQALSICPLGAVNLFFLATVLKRWRKVRNNQNKKEKN
jgi:hypothetical protein